MIEMQLSQKHILSLRDLSADDISLVLDTAENFKELLSRRVKKAPTLRGRAGTWHLRATGSCWRPSKRRALGLLTGSGTMRSIW